MTDYGPRAVLAGNPVRPSLEAQDETIAKRLKDEYKIDNSVPLILIFGGGLGAAGINRLVFKAAPELVKDYQVIHLTGKGKMPEDLELLKMDNYHVLEVLDNRLLSVLISMSDLVVARAGLGTLTELSYWRKPALLIPMPKSHQKDNAEYFSKAKAAVLADQDCLTPEKLISVVRDILNNPDLRRELGNNIGKIMKRGAAGTISSIIAEIISPQENNS